MELLLRINFIILTFENRTTLSFNKLLLASLHLYILPIKLIKILWSSNKHTLNELNVWFFINFTFVEMVYFESKSISLFFFSRVKPDDVVLLILFSVNLLMN